MVVTCILGEGTKVAGTLLPELASDHDTLRRFRREAEAAAGLGHPNIVQIIELVEEPSEAPILVMELVRGQSLRQLIAAEGQLAPARAAFIAMQVLSALAVTHEAHIIHRDIKPANVFISETRAIADFVTLLDFGVAKRPRRLRQHHPGASHALRAGHRDALLHGAGADAGSHRDRAIGSLRGGRAAARGRTRHGDSGRPVLAADRPLGGCSAYRGQNTAGEPRVSGRARR